MNAHGFLSAIAEQRRKVLVALRHKRWPGQIAQATGVLLCAGLFIHFLYLTCTNLVPGPYSDYWDDIPRLQKMFEGSAGWYDLVVAHNNAHRLLLPRLLFFIDYRFFNGSNIFLMLVSLTCKVALLLLINRALSFSTPIARLWTNVLVFAALFNAAAVSNVIVSSNVQWDLVLTLSTFALYVYCRAAQSADTASQLWLGTMWGYVLFILAAFSQAGALPVAVTFVWISLFYRRYAVMLCTLAASVVFVYLYLQVWPVAQPDNPDASSTVDVLFSKTLPLLDYLFKLLSAPLVHSIGVAGYGFSALFFGALVMAVRAQSQAFRDRQTSATQHTPFFQFTALFLFLFLSTIALARVEFTANTWWAVRYQPVVLLFVLFLALDRLSETHATGSSPKSTGWLLAAAAILFTVAHSDASNGYYKFSNRLLNTHSTLLAHERNNRYGAGLLLWITEPDVIAASDTFFIDNDAAYYRHKTLPASSTTELSKRIFVGTGSLLIDIATQSAFAVNCPSVSGHMEFRANPPEAIPDFHMPLELSRMAFLKWALFRNSMFMLDAQGKVTGFAYPHMDRESKSLSIVLNGYVQGAEPRYLAELRDDVPHCLYRLENR